MREFIKITSVTFAIGTAFAVLYTSSFIVAFVVFHNLRH